MVERYRPFPASYSPELSPQWEEAARVMVDIFLKATTQSINVEGKENIPKKEDYSSYIVAMNHLGWAEAIVLLDVFPSWIHWMSKIENFENKLLSPVVRLLGFFPVRRGVVDRQSLQIALNLLEKGRILGMAPEGTRGRGEEFGKLKKAKLGTVFIASQAKVPIIPTAVLGTEELFPLIEEKGLKIEDLARFKKPEVFVRIGRPFTQHLEVKDENLNKERFEKLTTNLMIEIRDMLSIKYHGFYAGRERELVT